MIKTLKMDRAAMAAFVERRQSALFRFCLFVCRDRTLAEEIAQETFTIALEKLSVRAPEGDEGKWLRGIARNIYLRHRARKHPLPLDGPLLESAEAYWVKQTGGGREDSPYAQALRGCLEQLKDEDRRMIDLRYRENPGRPALAGALGISVEALETRMKRVRKQLKECVERKVGGNRA